MTDIDKKQTIENKPSENPSGNKPATTKKKSVKATIGIIVGLLALLGASAFFIFRGTGNTTYREVRTGPSYDYSEYEDMELDEEEEVTPEEYIASSIHMNETSLEDEEEEEEDKNAYMTVTIPGFSREDEEKAEQEEAALQEEADNAGVQLSEIQQQQRTRTSTSSSSPSIVDHYYTDSSTGTQSSKPSSSSDTVYVMEYDKGQQLTESDIQNIILDYLQSDKTYVEDTTIKTTNGDNDILILGEDQGENGNSGSEINIGAEEEGIVSSDIEGDAINKEGTYVRSDDDIQPYLQWYMNRGEKNDGTITLNTIGAERSEIHSITWEANIVAGDGYLVDTEDPLVKAFHVDDASAIQVAAVVTYKHGLVKTTDVTLIFHEGFSMDTTSKPEEYTVQEQMVNQGG